MYLLASQQLLLSHTTVAVKGIFQPFELGGETIVIRSAVKHYVPGKFLKVFLMIHSHERSIKHISAV